jgi:hypothetical protein
MHAIDERLPEICLERTLAPWLEPVQVSERCHHRVLHQIDRIHGVARPVRQPSGRPSTQQTAMTGEERVKSAAVAGAKPFE